MQPNHYDLLGQVHDDPRSVGRLTRDAHQPPSREPHAFQQSRSPAAVAPTRSEDSWIENEAGAYHRSRRRRLQRLAAVTTAQVDYSSREQSSSQDEYEESESESDRVLSSSNEDMPNVFSHPPASQNTSWRPSGGHRSQPSEVSNSSRRTAIRRNSQASIRSARRSSQQHSPFNMISPSHHADHDAALRASLSTLLSCAAAARGLPKSDPPPSQASPSRGHPSSFRLVPESVAMGGEVGEEAVGTEATVPTRTPRQGPTPQPASYSPRDAQSATRAKRRSSPSKERSHSSAKKGRRASIADASTASPTVMTWVISAGVVVLFSAISFSAGYVLGREVGRLEASTGMTVAGDTGVPGRAAAGCGQEAVRGGLKRIRWGSGTSGSGIIA
ncbi:Glycosyl hydrolases 28 family protein [Aspergillus niger]|uniref:Glycosyl hydrolases 28 family protein n=1 Tax=Aspergillus niger TaxID=5061 RepID=A0A505I6F0_ASPNG|nr:Glycosyl hydrolases 28 family protein [Aspergillus niger]